MKKFCPKCGKNIDEGIFCDTCESVSLEFKPVNIKLCPSGKYFFRGKWTSFNNLEDVTNLVINKSLKKKIKVLKSLADYPDLLEKTGMKKVFETIIDVEGDKFVFPMNVEITTSPGFSKVGSSYFEGILQLRHADKNVKSFVNKIIDKTNDLYVNKIVDKKDSVDYYFVKKKFLSRVAEKIVNEYGGYKDMNAQLFTQDKQTSKELFRLNVVVYIPPFRKDDVVFKHEELFFVIDTGKQNKCLDLKSGKKFSLKYDPEQIHEYKVLEKQKTNIINIFPISVLSKKSYEVVEVQNPFGLVVEQNQDVFIIEHEGFAYLVK